MQTKATWRKTRPFGFKDLLRYHCQDNVTVSGRRIGAFKRKTLKGRNLRCPALKVRLHIHVPLVWALLSHSSTLLAWEDTTIHKSRGATPIRKNRGALKGWLQLCQPLASTPLPRITYCVSQMHVYTDRQKHIHRHTVSHLFLPGTLYVS